MVSRIDLAKTLEFPPTEIQAVERALDHKAGPGHPASNLKPGTLSADGIAVVGENGYFFIANGSNQWERQYLGKMTGLENWAASWKRVLANRQVAARHLGIQLINLIVPEKQVLFSHQRWAQAAENGNHRPMRYLQALLAAEDHVIYPEEEMRQVLASGPTHHRHDSHWNISGCRAGTQPVLQALNAGVDLESLKLMVRLLNAPLDLTNHFFVEPPSEESLLLAPKGSIVADNQQIPRTGRNTGAFYVISNPDAADSRKVVVLGDSYAYDGGLTFLLSAVFQTVVFLWSKSIDWNFIREQQADIVLWEHAERYITSLPDS